jgi:hypothetical protein
MRGVNEVAQAMEILGIAPDDSGKFNLANDYSLNRRPNESRITDLGLNFNLGDSLDKNRTRELYQDE